jgi:hypothetical protein
MRGDSPVTPCRPCTESDEDVIPFQELSHPKNRSGRVKSLLDVQAFLNSAHEPKNYFLIKNIFQSSQKGLIHSISRRSFKISEPDSYPH